MKKITRHMSGAQAVVQSIIDAGADTIFGYPGGAIMPVYDALYDYKDKIHHILVRHEQGASHAAEGYARVTGKSAVCIVTSGPGATNLVTGVTDAMIDSVPMVCITGQVPTAVIGTDAFQEADVIGIMTPITKWCYQITKAEEIPYIMAKAFYIANTGRPGPVVIDITKNAQFESLEYKYPKKIEIPGYKPNYLPNLNKIKKAAQIINKAKNPFVLVGHGVLIAKAEKELREFIEKGEFPIAATLHGLSSFPSDHKQYVGMLGMHGNYGPNKLTNKADVILAIGLRFDDRVTGRVSDYAKNVKIIHIDIDTAELNKIIKSEIAIQSDAKQALKALTPLIKKKSHKMWLEEFRKCDEQEDKKVHQLEAYPKNGQIRMAEVVRILSEKTKGEAVIIADVGQHQMIAARYYKFKNPNSYITSGGLGTMGFALPAAIGAKVADSKKEVVAIIGDGSFQMNIQELGTIFQENLPVKIIILNNDFLGMVRQWQELFFDNRYSFVDLKNPDFVAISKGYFIPAEKVEKREQLDQALNRLLEAKGPYLLDVKVLKEGNVFPMVPSGASVDEIRLE